jgi:two-component system nitrate/nitrite response regulator NarL
MPGGGVAAAQAITRACPAIKVLFLTVSEDDQDVFACLEAGASGYILKGIGSSELASMVWAVHQGEMTITPSLAARLLASIGKKHYDSSVSAYGQCALTSREDEILDQVARGLTNKEVARMLRLSEKTIKHHMTSIMQKLHVRNRVEAAMRLRRMTLSRGPDKSSNEVDRG